MILYNISAEIILLQLLTNISSSNAYFTEESLFGVIFYVVNLRNESEIWDRPRWSTNHSKFEISNLIIGVL